MATPSAKPALAAAGSVGDGSLGNDTTGLGAGVAGASAGMLGNTSGDVVAVQTEGAAVAISTGTKTAGLPV